VIRPADANETSHAWRVAIEHKTGPVALVLTRQGLPVADQTKYASAASLERGAYIISESDSTPQVILIGTGSEVQLLLKVQPKLKEQGIQARVISMPSWELFEMQDNDYKEKIFPKNIRKRLAVEAASPLGWHKYVTDEGDVLGINRFGESAPGDEVMKEFGFTVENVIDRVKKLLAK